METVRLNNGIEMPLLGYGLFKVDPKDAQEMHSVWDIG